MAGGYYNDLEIQTTLEMLSAIPQPLESHYIYDIGGKDGIYSQSYKYAANRIVVACESEEYSDHLAKAQIVKETVSQLNDTNRMVDLIRIDNEPEALQTLKNVICTCMPIVLITVQSTNLDLVLPYMLDFGYSYYMLIDHPDPFKRQFVHQLEKSIDKVRLAIEEQPNQTLLLYVLYFSFSLSMLFLALMDMELRFPIVSSIPEISAWEFAFLSTSYVNLFM